MAEKNFSPAREKTVEKILLVFAILLLLAGSYYSTILSSKVGGLLPALVSASACAKTGPEFGSEYWLALPTSPQVCDKLRQGRSFTEVECWRMPAAKQAACEKLQKIFSQRLDDCFSAVLLNKTSSFEQESPDATQACEEFVA